MSTGKVVWGIVFVFIGLILLLSNFGVIDFYWRVIFQYWPILLILAGVNMLFSRNNSQIGGIVTIAATCIVLGIITYSGINYRRDNPTSWFNYKEHALDSDERLTDNVFTEEMAPSTEKAELNIIGGATSYKLEDSTSHLFSAGVRQASGRYSLKKTSRNGVEVLNFTMNERHGNWNSEENNVELQLNKLPVWNINIKIGAGEADLDLSKFKVGDVVFEGGAASLKLKFGMPEDNSNVTVKTGVSDIDISVPKAAACQIKVSSGLSSKDFDGFIEQPDGSYATPGFNTAPKKISINLKGGMSNFEVKRY